MEQKARALFGDGPELDRIKFEAFVKSFFSKIINSLQNSKEKISFRMLVMMLNTELDNLPNEKFKTRFRNLISKLEDDVLFCKDNPVALPHLKTHLMERYHIDNEDVLNQLIASVSVFTAPSEDATGGL